MKILKNKQSGNTVSLEIEESIEKLKGAMDVAFRKLVQHARIPGFRKGKVPRPLFEKHYGQEPLIEEAVKDVVNDAYFEALQELKLKVIDSPKNLKVNEYKADQPVIFTLEVEVLPEVKLGKYKGIKVKKETADVSDAKIQEQIDHIRNQFARHEPVERSSQDEDILRCNIEATVAGNAYANWTRRNVAVRLGAGYYGKELDQQLTGLLRDAKKTASITYPAEFPNPDVAGKTVDFSIEVVEVLEKKLPELTDEFAAKISECKTVGELKDRIRKQLEQNEEHRIQDKLRADLMDAVAADAKVEIPTVLIDREVDHAISQFSSQLQHSSRINLEQYLKLSGKTLDDVRKDYRANAEKNVRRELVLDAVAEKEKLSVSDPDLEAEISTWNHGEYKNLDDVRKNPNLSIESLRSSVRQKKTYEFLISEAKIS